MEAEGGGGVQFVAVDTCMTIEGVANVEEDENCIRFFPKGAARATEVEHDLDRVQTAVPVFSPVYGNKRGY